MFKSFALAAIAPLAVLGKGTNDGSSRENARTVTLMDDTTAGTRKMDLSLYNVANGTIDELHLDLDYTFTEQSKNQRFGWCFAETGTEKWDCFVVRTDLAIGAFPDPTFIVEDFVYNGAQSALTKDTFTSLSKDTSADAGPLENWKYAKGKSTDPPTTQCKDSAKADTFFVDYVDCNGLDVHAYRNFSTGTENNSAADDIAVTLDDPTKTYDAFGFSFEFSKNASVTGALSGTKIGSVVKIQPVS